MVKTLVKEDELNKEKREGRQSEFTSQQILSLTTGV